MPSPKKKTGLVFDVTAPSKNTAARPAAAAPSPAASPAASPASRRPPTPRKPAPSPAPRKPAPPAEDKDVFAYRKTQRSVWLAENIHSEAKMLAARLRYRSLRDYIEEVLRRDLEAHGISVPEDPT